MDFKEKLHYVDTVRKLDATKFENVKDLTAAIDFNNKQLEEKAEARGESETREISKFVIDMLTKNRHYTFLSGVK
jgi:PDZ domain-containing secreted protein